MIPLVLFVLVAALVTVLLLWARAEEQLKKEKTHSSLFSKRNRTLVEEIARLRDWDAEPVIEDAPWNKEGIYFSRDELTLQQFAEIGEYVSNGADSYYYAGEWPGGVTIECDKIMMRGIHHERRAQRLEHALALCADKLETAREDYERAVGEYRDAVLDLRKQDEEIGRLKSIIGESAI
jgi:hypothetical protein